MSDQAANARMSLWDGQCSCHCSPTRAHGPFGHNTVKVLIKFKSCETPYSRNSTAALGSPWFGKKAPEGPPVRPQVGEEALQWLQGLGHPLLQLRL